MLMKTFPVIDPTWLVAILIHFESEIVQWFVLRLFSKSSSILSLKFGIEFGP